MTKQEKRANCTKGDSNVVAPLHMPPLRDLKNKKVTQEEDRKVSHTLIIEGSLLCT